MSNKQSSIEWLIEQLTINPISDITDEQWFGIMGEAKAMHKEETCQFVSDYLDDGQDMTAEEYYEEIYGEEK